MPWRAPHHHAGGDLRRARDSRRGDPFYKTARWRRLRAWILSRHPLCADPFGLHAAERIECLATEVHHRIERSLRPDLELEPGNLVALCKSCHSRVTNPAGPGS